MSILLADDDAHLATFLSKSLESEGYAVRTALDEESARSELARQNYRLIILDLNFGGTDGLVLLESLRASGVSTPVIVLSARNRVSDRIESLNLGADDYITKPFSFQELAARVGAILRRKADPSLNVLRVEDLELDPVSRKVRRGKRSIKLSPKEFGLLHLLLRRAGETVSRRELLEDSWATDTSESNLVDVYVNYLRKKVDTGGSQRLIHTVRGEGYRLGRPAPVGSRGPALVKPSERPVSGPRYPAPSFDSGPSMPLRSLVHSLVHDLAQPLTSVRCFLEVLGMRGLPTPSQQNELRTMEQQADRAIALCKGVSALVRDTPAPATPWTPLDQLLGDLFGDFALVMNSGMLALERRWGSEVQVSSNPALRQLLVLLVSKVVASVARPLALTVSATIAEEGRCQIGLQWRAADNQPVNDSRTVLVKDLTAIHELTFSLGLDFSLPEGKAAIVLKVPAMPMATAAKADAAR